MLRRSPFPPLVARFFVYAEKLSDEFVDLLRKHRENSGFCSPFTAYASLPSCCGKLHFRIVVIKQLAKKHPNVKVITGNVNSHINAVGQVSCFLRVAIKASGAKPAFNDISNRLFAELGLWVFRGVQFYRYKHRLAFSEKHESLVINRFVGYVHCRHWRRQKKQDENTKQFTHSTSPLPKKFVPFGAVSLSRVVGCVKQGVQSVG